MIYHIDTGSPEYERRCKQAEERAQWELGDSSWAGYIIAAFLDPEADAAMLQREMEATDA